MSVPELEARLRRLKLAEPPPALAQAVLATAKEALGYRRHLRLAWGSAAAAAVMAVGVSWRGPEAPRAPVPALEIPPEIAEIDPALARRLQFLAQASPRVDPWKALRAQAESMKSLTSLEGEIP